MIRTNEGANAYEHSLNHSLEFFSKAGSIFSKKGKQRFSFYGNEESALSLFQKSWIVDPALTLKILFFLRDCRGGSGNRSAARDCYKWLAENDPKWLAANIGWLPLIGRWDDLRALFGTDLEKEAAMMWAAALKERDVLAAKWADRSDSPIRMLMEMKIGDFRRFLAGIRSKHLVETKMCDKNWNEINYEHVPSVAMARYTKAFGRNDTERFEAYKEALASGKAEIKAGVLFPHDCVRTVFYGDSKIADAQFEALPNYMEGTDEKIIVICDTSGSMNAAIAPGSSVLNVHVSQGLALYCSAKMPKDGPFYKKFIAFESESEFKDWEGMSFSKAVRNKKIFDRAIGSTRIDTALDLILGTAKMFKIPQDLMPTMLLIVSDMQFHQGAAGKDTEVARCMKAWNDAGYESPKIVYWNLAGYPGQQATIKTPNTALVSGFSPSILKAILTGDDFSPLAVMLRAIEKYDITIP